MGTVVAWIAALCGLALVIVALAATWLAWRRLRTLHVGGVDVALRLRKDERGRSWHLGVAHYRGEEFVWYRALSVRSGPNLVMNRRNVEITERRRPSMAESHVVPAGSTVLDLSGHDSEMELAMGGDALTGFLSWLESAPPSGRSVPWSTQ